MKTLYFIMVWLIWFIFAISNGSCLSDVNLQTGSLCSEADSSLNGSTFQTNLRALLDSLAANVVPHSGFYQNHIGKKSNKVYGLILCRGDISADDCTNCTLSSIKAASDDCPKSKIVSAWFRWCFLRYSNESFLGVMEQTASAITNDTDFDEPSAVSKGLSFMSGLAVTASEQKFMFQTAILNVSQSGKRYGMAQCTRDINKKDCMKCLEAQLVSFRTLIGNKRRWEIYGFNCFMWYNDYQFYSDFSILLSAARRLSSCRRFTIGMTIAVLAALVIVL